MFYILVGTGCERSTTVTIGHMWVINKDLCSYWFGGDFCGQLLFEVMIQFYEFRFGGCATILFLPLGLPSPWGKSRWSKTLIEIRSSNRMMGWIHNNVLQLALLFPISFSKPRAFGWIPIWVPAERYICWCKCHAWKLIKQLISPRASTAPSQRFYGDLASMEVVS